MLAIERDFVFIDLDERIDIGHAICGRIEFLAADVLGPVNHLALEIGEIDHVEIDQADATHAGGGEIQAERRAQAACADQQDLGVFQFQLPVHADFGHDQVARIAQDFVL